ncbi:MAG: lytic murein transglycosylase [Hyphomicrobiales bacterium]|nr:lytic murein transglycosylase [Hyphomicrobiales bacterium]
MRAIVTLTALAAVLAALADASHAASKPGFTPAPANCRNTGDFDGWLSGFKREAAAAGVSRATLASVDGDLRLDESVIRKDRGQGVFGQPFLEFAGRMVEKSGRVAQGKARIAKYRDAFARIEQKYGVPASVITGFWALETDFGANSGKTPIIPALATLAYDCRRGPMFREELLAALRIIDQRKLPKDELIGAWAGEIGQMQFLPAHYLNYGVDFDGDGKVDLRNSVPDVLASTANLLKGMGWRRSEPWLEEVRAPERMPWQEADIAIQHPRSIWAGWGVRRADGSALPSDGRKASLILPMGRNGPAFLAYDNFKVYTEWNQSFVYATTAAYLATRLDGAPPVNRGNGEVTPLNQAQSKELQQLLARRGFDVGKLDGIIGLKTRQAVKAMQLEFGMPADSYPTPELLSRLR